MEIQREVMGRLEGLNLRECIYTPGGKRHRLSYKVLNIVLGVGFWVDPPGPFRGATCSREGGWNGGGSNGADAGEVGTVDVR